MVGRERREKLTLAWVTVSKDPDSQTSRDFWANFGSVFHDIMGCRSRNFDAICSKFRVMRVKCREFDKLYNFVINNAHEDNLVVVVTHQYEDINHKPLTHLKLWLKVKESPRWNN